MHLLPTPAGLRAAAVLPALLLATGCMVDSRCFFDSDCDGRQRCDSERGCYVECTRDSDCLEDGANVGKRCVDQQCEFRLAERVAAPEFCLGVVNPRSPYSGQQLCLSRLRGKVVFVYFALLA